VDVELETNNSDGQYNNDSLPVQEETLKYQLSSIPVDG